MFNCEALVGEMATIDAGTTRSIVVGNVTSLDHEFFDNLDELIRTINWVIGRTGNSMGKSKKRRQCRVVGSEKKWQRIGG